MSDPGDIIVKRWEFGKTSMFKAPTCILLSPDGSNVEAFGFDAERMFAALVKQGRHRDYFFFFRFKLELQKLINKVSLSLKWSYLTLTMKRRSLFTQERQWFHLPLHPNGKYANI